MKAPVISALILTTLLSVGCREDKGDQTPHEKELPEEYYTGGKLGTTFNISASCFEQPTQSVDDSEALSDFFDHGERRFEQIHQITDETDNVSTYRGLGPLYNRTACKACHPNYSHGQRVVSRYDSDRFGNGSLIIVSDKEGNIASSLGLVPMTRAVYPFKPMINADKMKVEWVHYKDEWDNTFPDGETYDLIYPEITIPEEALYSPLKFGGKPANIADADITFESTIGLYGTGLLDAIADEDLKKQYEEEAKYIELNPAMWDKGKNDFAETAYAGGRPMRFDYACDFSKLTNNVSLYEVTNIIPWMKSHRRFYFPDDSYAKSASEDPDVQREFYKYYPQWKKSGNVKKDIYDFLTCKELPVEMDREACYSLMVWLRGLAVPVARHLDDPKVQRGKKLFTEMGCATCHRPSWTTGEDVVNDEYGLAQAGQTFPRYPHQKIWPYSDLIQHRLHMENDIRTGWCRTTPLWGRGLTFKATGHDDRLHDCRARGVLEAIMWHGNKQSDARESIEHFRELTKADRDAVVAFIEAI